MGSAEFSLYSPDGDQFAHGKRNRHGSTDDFTAAFAKPIWRLRVNSDHSTPPGDPMAAGVKVLRSGWAEQRITSSDDESAPAHNEADADAGDHAQRPSRQLTLSCVSIG